MIGSLLWQSPLLIGCDIRHASRETLAILGNKEVIDVNQDPLGAQGRKIRSSVGLEVPFTFYFSSNELLKEEVCIRLGEAIA